MTYATILVCMELRRTNQPRLAAAIQLAARLKAHVIGIAVCQPLLVGSSDGYMPASVLEQDRQNIDDEIGAAEREFRAACEVAGLSAAWRSIITFEALSITLAREARCADLIITAPSRERSLFDPSRYVDLGDLVMTAGRPCLIVPDESTGLNLDRMVVTWKDCPEARRAVYDAVPLLTCAQHVSVLELAPLDGLGAARTGVGEIVSWLGHHNVKAEGKAEELLDDAKQLGSYLGDSDGGVIVAGAYGHSRFQEWVFGGVTRDLLLKGSRCALVAH